MRGKKLLYCIALGVFWTVPSFSVVPPSLSSDNLELKWVACDDGIRLDSIKVRATDGWKALKPAEHQHRVLYSAEKPGTDPQAIYDRQGREIAFPEPQYRYIIASWQQNNTDVALNKAGMNIPYLPATSRMDGDVVVFCYENENMTIEERWRLDSRYAGDIIVEMSLKAKHAGYWSLTTPSLAVADKYDFQWAAVPGVYQGSDINSDYVRALAYGQGIPDAPVVSRERTASTLTSMITDKSGVTLAVTAEPGTARDPWEYDTKTHSLWKLGLSLMNRDGEFSPTLYHPVLGESGSYLDAGGSVSFSFRYTVCESDWYPVLKHVAEDVYAFSDCLKLKRTAKPLTERLYDMHRYLVNDSTSMWRNSDYKGVLIGAQDYRGGVYGSEKDAMKNSDYGAMWMLASMTGDERLTKSRLPYALNFKLMQQNDAPGALYGSSAGQYYLYKSRRFTEEWGPYTEPIATTYYMLMDMGNVLLFEPGRKDIKKHLRVAADCLLKWMKPDGNWEVAYDNETGSPMFTDVKDLRPTFYGLLVAYEILRDRKYLDAACKGADWYVKNAVEKGHFLGVCGDTRFAPDFASAQAVQALLEIAEATGLDKYRVAAIKAAKIYTTSIYTHPVPSTDIKKVKGVELEDWEIAQAGLGFEHGGVIGSANHRGPILLASHAGMFVRMYGITHDSLFLNMARAAAIGRDAFVDKKTGVASYYWDSMDNGAGPYPHHAWWQIGWITDYLISEAQIRSDGRISFPCGFITPKVGPHRTYGFAPGTIYGAEAGLVMRQKMITTDNPYFEYLTAFDKKTSTLYVIFMNNDDDRQAASVSVDEDKLFGESGHAVVTASIITADGQSASVSAAGKWNISVEAYGLKVLKIRYK